MTSPIAEHIRNNKLSYQLLAYILLSSTMFTLIASAVQLSMEYRKDIQAVEDEFALIEKGYVNSIAGSLWAYDSVQLETQIKGILSLPNISRVEVSDNIGSTEKKVASLGDIVDRNYTEKSYPVVYSDGDRNVRLGTLKVYAGLDFLRDKTVKKAVSTFVMKIAEMLLLAMVMLVIFHHVIMKHLNHISRFLEDVDINRLDERLVLNKTVSEKKDILDSIVSAVNSILEYLDADIARRVLAEETLMKINDDLENSKKEIEVQSILKTMQMAVSDIIREEESLTGLAARLTAHFCETFQAGAGIFYHVDFNDKIVNPVGFYAIGGGGQNGQSFHVGEGLVGQAVKEGRMVELVAPDQPGFSIQSSLGFLPPNHILIFPFKSKGTVTAAVELGSFNPFTKEQVRFIESISEMVAMAAETAFVRSQRVKLVTILEEKAEELDRREREYRKSEELFRWVFNLSDRMLILLNEEGTIIGINDKARVVSRYPNPLGEPLSSAFDWAGGDDEQEALNQSIAGCLAGHDAVGTFSIRLEGAASGRYEFIFRKAEGESSRYCGFIMDGKEITTKIDTHKGSLWLADTDG
jgi:PAS domain-containing protein